MCRCSADRLGAIKSFVSSHNFWIDAYEDNANDKKYELISCDT